LSAITRGQHFLCFCYRLSAVRCQLQFSGTFLWYFKAVIRSATWALILAVTAVCQSYGAQAGQDQAQLKTVPPAERVRTEIPYRDGTVVIVSDFQERVSKTRYRAQGHVEIAFQDMMMTADAAEYDEETRQGFTTGQTRFSQKTQWLSCSRAEFDFTNQTGVFYDASGFTDREFLVRGNTVLKTGRDRYVLQSGIITACQEKRPKWSFGTSTANVRVDHTARLRNMIFRIKGIPVLYLPYLVVPLEQKSRSSGFIPFHTGTSTSKGRLFSQGYYQTLGKSADATLYADYFTLRGLAVGGILRARPNPNTHLFLQAYGINDKLGQGGALVIADGESLLSNGFRAVARVNITTNFRFRQAFADTFRSATIPQENSVLFLTRNHDSFSTNILFQRHEVLFPGRSLVVRKSPSVEFFSLGMPVGKLPLIFYLRTSADGVSRIDSRMETPKMVQRFDLFPRLELRLPSFAGFSLIPTAGVRETFYSARISDETTSEVIPRRLERRYAEFELDLRTPTLERDFGKGDGSLRHVVEPVITYRRISGIDNLREIVRFDEEDAIADTNEVEYGIVNRLFRRRDQKQGGRGDYELLSFTLAQKYYFDPTFGGAFREGELNQFYPLNTLTGFSLTGIQRNLAPTSMVLRVNPLRGISYDVRSDFDSKLQSFRDASLSALWQREKLFVAGTYFKTKALEPGLYESNHIQGQAGYGSMTRGFSGSVTLSYNIQSSKLLNSHTRMSYMWDCCGLAMEFQQFDLGLRTESRFSFSFTLKGIGSFGNLKRPESLF
jgi:LPS-assembly protein